MLMRCSFSTPQSSAELASVLRESKSSRARFGDARPSQGIYPAIHSCGANGACKTSKD